MGDLQWVHILLVLEEIVDCRYLQTTTNFIRTIARIEPEWLLEIAPSLGDSITAGMFNLGSVSVRSSPRRRTEHFWVVAGPDRQEIRLEPNRLQTDPKIAWIDRLDRGLIQPGSELQLLFYKYMSYYITISTILLTFSDIYSLLDNSLSQSERLLTSSFFSSFSKYSILLMDVSPFSLPLHPGVYFQLSLHVVICDCLSLMLST